MSGGFEAVPELMRQTASQLTDLTGEVEQLVWQGPSGDYGDARLQSAWSEFIETNRDRVHALRERAEEHGLKLGDAAAAYHEIEESGEAAAKKIGGMLDGLAGAATGGLLGGSGGSAGSSIRPTAGPVGGAGSPRAGAGLGHLISDVLDHAETGGSPQQHEGPVY